MRSRLCKHWMSTLMWIPNFVILGGFLQGLLFPVVVEAGRVGGPVRATASEGLCLRQCVETVCGGGGFNSACVCDAVMNQLTWRFSQLYECVHENCYEEERKDQETKAWVERLGATCHYYLYKHLDDKPTTIYPLITGALPTVTSIASPTVPTPVPTTPSSLQTHLPQQPPPLLQKLAPRSLNTTFIFPTLSPTWAIASSLPAETTPITLPTAGKQEMSTNVLLPVYIICPVLFLTVPLGLYMFFRRGVFSDGASRVTIKSFGFTGAVHAGQDEESQNPSNPASGPAKTGAMIAARELRTGTGLPAMAFVPRRLGYGNKYMYAPTTEGSFGPPNGVDRYSQKALPPTPLPSPPLELPSRIEETSVPVLAIPPTAAVAGGGNPLDTISEASEGIEEEDESEAELRRIYREVRRAITVSTSPESESSGWSLGEYASEDKKS